MGKKGLSSVVATVSLVLLTFVAVMIIAGFIIPFVKNSLNESTECENMREYFTFSEDFGYNCFRQEGNNVLYGVSVEAKGADNEVEERVSGFKLAFITPDGESEPVEVWQGSDDFSQSGSVGKIRRVNTSLSLEIPESGGVRTYVYNSSKKFDVVIISPRLNSGRPCEKSDSIKIGQYVCDESLDLTVI